MAPTEEGSTYPHLADYDDQLNDQHELLDGASADKPFDRLIKPTRCNGCTVIVEPMLFLFMMSQFPLFILMPQYYQRREWESLMGNATYPNSHNACVPLRNLSSTDDPIMGNLSLASSAASLFNLQSNLASALPAIPAIMFLGPYSDRVGRKYALVIPIIGQALASLCTMVNVYFNLPLPYLLIGSVIYGCCGYWVTLFMGVISYISDITTKERRSFRIVMAEVCSLVPTILSAAGSGFWVEAIGFSYVFLIIFLFNIVILLYTIFLVPETIRRDHTARFFSLEHTKRAITVFAVDDGTKRRWKLLTLLLTFLLYIMVSIGGIDTYFVQNQPLCWGTVLIGIYTGTKIAVNVVNSGVLSKVLSRFLKDAWIVVIALSLGVAGSIFTFFVVSTAMMFGSIAFHIMGIISAPTVRSMISKLVSPSDIGAVFSGVAVVEVICQLLGSAILNPIYSATEMEGHPSAVYLVVAAIYFGAFSIMLTYAILTRKDVEKKDPVSKEVPVKPQDA